MFNRYLFNRLRLMGFGEISKRVVETVMDYARFSCKNLIRPNIPSQRFLSFLPSLDKNMLSQLWEDHPWHEDILNDLLSGKFEVTGKNYEFSADNIWTYCPIKNKQTASIMGRRFLFHKMYAEADIEYINTLNRHYHLIHLAKAASLGKVEENIVLDPIYDWIDKNPYLTGINWADCLNHAVRITNWCLIFSLLKMKSVPQKISQSLHEQGIFIEDHLSYGSSAANHLIGELWGLFFLGHCFPDLPKAKHWRGLSKRLLATEVQKQFCNDGLHREGSISYHRYLIEYLLLVLICAKKLAIDLDDTIEKTVSKGVDRIADLMNSTGEIPQLGDFGHESTTDIHYTSYKVNDLYTSTLHLAACHFKDHSKLTLSFPDHLEQRTNWLFNEPIAAQNYHTMPARPSTAFSEIGWYILRCGKSFEKETSMLIKCGKMGYGPLCAHAHADQLSFVLSVQGVEFLIDPGSYTYHSKGIEWREHFRSTQAHNSYSLKEQNQAKSGGAMIWLTHANGTVDKWQSSDDFDFFSGSLKRDSSEEGGLLQHRQIYLNKNANHFEIRDTVKKRGKARLKTQLFLHFHPEVNITLKGQSLEASRLGRTLSLTLDPRCTVECFHGNEENHLGWYAPLFGIRYPSHSLRLSAEVASDDQIITQLQVTS